MRVRLSVFLLVTALAVGLLASSSVVTAKPVAPDPDGLWAGQADWGERFIWENENAVGYPGSHYWSTLDVGVGLNSYDPYKQDWTSSGSATFNARAYLEGGGPYLVVVDNLQADESYVFGLDFVSGADRPNSAVFKWELENSTHVFVPDDYLAVIDNVNGGGFGSSPDVNLRAEDNHVFKADDTANIVYENAVNVEVSPSLGSGDVGDTLSYTVTVHNNSSFYDQTFDLSATDSEDWTISFDDNSLFASAGSSASTTMRVTLEGGSSDDITVWADSALIENDSATCQASGEVIVDFNTWIEPSINSGFRGSGLSWTVNVRNTGNVSGNYDLTVSDNAGWGDNVSLSSDNMVGVSPGSTGTATLRVTVPDNAGYGDHNISVKATSQENASLSKENRCTVRVVGHVRLYDDSNDKVGDYSEIQPAVDDASQNYKVLVSPGTYQENLMMDVPNLTLQSSDGTSSTIIESQGEDPEFGVAIDNDNVRLQGFTIEGGLPLVAGIESPENVTGTIIENVTLRSDNGPGILLFGGDMTIDNSIIDGADVTGGVDEFMVTGGIFALASDIDISDSKIINWNGDNCVAIVLNPPLSPAQPARLVMENCRIENSNAGAIGFSNSNFVIENSVIDGSGATALGNGGAPPPLGLAVLDNSELIVSGSDIVNWNLDNSVATVIGNPGLDPSKPSSMSIVDSLVENNFIGVMVGGNGSLLAKFTSFENNFTGVGGFDYASIEFCSFLGNDNGVLNLGGDPTWNARKNWWGDPSGPGGSGSGSGDNVSENVVFTPWLLGQSPEPEAATIELGSNSEELDNIGVELDSTGEGKISAVKIDNFGGISLPENRSLAGMYVDVSTIPDNLAENVTITIHYSDNDVEGIAEENLDLYYWNRTDENWQVCDNISVNTEGNTITGSVSHLTPFAPMGPPSAANVDVSISPNERETVVGETLTYDVTVVNTGSDVDNFDLTLSDDAGWNPSLETALLEGVSAGESRVVTLSVTIPSGAEPCTRDNITVVATSQVDNEASDNDTCVAHAIASKPLAPDPEGLWAGQADWGERFIWENEDAVGYPSSHYWASLDVGVGLNPYDPYKQDWTGSGAATFNVRAYLEGGGPYLAVVDNLRTDEAYVFGLDFVSGADRPNNALLKWDLENATHRFLPVGYSAVFENVSEDFFLNLYETDNYRFTTNDSVTLYIDNFAPEVNVSVLGSSYKDGTIGGTVEYEVKIESMADDVSYLDRLAEASFAYDLSISDDAGWNLSLDNTMIENLRPGESVTTKLTVSVPGSADNCTEDNVNIMATSLTDRWVTGSATCTAHAVNRGVSVSILPGDQEGNLGESVSYTVNITNEGSVEDNYSLDVSGEWSSQLSASTVSLGAGGSASVTLNVTIPDGAVAGESKTVTVTATSQTDSNVSGSGSSTVTVSGAAAPPTGEEEEEEEEAPVGGVPSREEEDRGLPLVIIVIVAGIVVLSVGYILGLGRK
ncbi:hypothetical protein AKJ54_00760 [candidate division MSBL1 archaeon SCGC-AAA382K21]|uniref:DUF11 domain-containing protein n=1 Tax=candidate division MSBL1 archaeon SCGC-AAA382K21 TaxID=1698283 RepID=A0A133VKY0_9EURY|nr:hypothetical protein AKJ54_00760 [candidate division MSBL1 archaeon SCGC-AAA382K21]